MPRVFLETKYDGKLEVPKEIVQKLPKQIVLAMPVQFLSFQEQIKKQLERAGKKVILFQSRHGKYLGQILGCDVFKFKGDYDAFFYIGDGKFHPTALLYENKKPVYCYNPFNQKLEVLEQKDLDLVLKRRQGQLAKFLNSKSVGILVTTKPGQNKSTEAEELREKLEKAGKEVLVFLADEINFASLENFNFVDVWINTACPRIVEDFKGLNRSDLKEIGF
ncbi:MAG: diphthamide synthesis protein [Candidatus Woesearchaeota archaeon]